MNPNQSTDSRVIRKDFVFSHPTLSCFNGTLSQFNKENRFSNESYALNVVNEFDRYVTDEILPSYHPTPTERIFCHLKFNGYIPAKNMNRNLAPSWQLILCTSQMKDNRSCLFVQEIYQLGNNHSITICQKLSEIIEEIFLALLAISHGFDFSQNRSDEIKFRNIKRSALTKIDYIISLYISFRRNKFIPLVVSCLLTNSYTIQSLLLQCESVLYLSKILKKEIRDTHLYDPSQLSYTTFNLVNKNDIVDNRFNLGRIEYKRNINISRSFTYKVIWNVPKEKLNNANNTNSVKFDFSFADEDFDESTYLPIGSEGTSDEPERTLEFESSISSGALSSDDPINELRTELTKTKIVEDLSPLEQMNNLLSKATRSKIVSTYQEDSSLIRLKFIERFAQLISEDLNIDNEYILNKVIPPKDLYDIIDALNSKGVLETLKNRLNIHYLLTIFLLSYKHTFSTEYQETYNELKTPNGILRAYRDIVNAFIDHISNLN